MGDGGYKIRDKEGVHFVTFAVLEWVDVFTPQLPVVFQTSNIVSW